MPLEGEDDGDGTQEQYEGGPPAMPKPEKKRMSTSSVGLITRNMTSAAELAGQNHLRHT